MEKLKTIASIFADFSIFAATFLGGLWAFYRFKISRENKPTPQLDLEYKVIPYTKESNFLAMGVHIKNVGKYDMHPRKILLSIKSLSKNFSIGKSPHWENGNLILDKFDVILDANPHMKIADIDDYLLPPNDKYIEVATLIISKEEKFLLAQISYLDKDGNDFSIYKFLQV